MGTPSKYLTGLLVLALWPLGAAAQSFSADTVFRSQSGKTYKGKVYRADDLVRAEAFAPSPNANSTFLIVDLERQVGYTISDRQKFIMVGHGQSELRKVGMVVPAGVDPCQPLDAPPGKQFSCKQVGEEPLNGRHTLKLEMSETENGLVVSRYSWFDPKLRVVIRVDMGNSTIMELDNIHEGPQPAGLFVIPAGYRHMDAGTHQGFGLQH